MALHDDISDLLDVFLGAKTLGTAETATKLTGLCNWKDPENFCWTLWTSVIARACDDSTDNDEGRHLDNIERLVDLTAAIKAEPALRNPETGEAIAFWAGTCWKDLPVLGPVMRETLDDVQGQRTYYTIFAARLTAREIDSYALFALWAFREALEGDIPWCPSGPGCDTVPAACAWVKHAGKQLIKLDETYDEAGQGGALWSGKPGFCRERWQLWREGFRRAAEDEELSPDVKAEAGQAADRIDQLLLLH